MIAHVCKMKGLSGCEKQLLALLPALRTRGWDVRLLVLEERGVSAADIAAQFEGAGVPTERVPMSRHGGAGLLMRLAGRLKTLKPGLVHTHLVHADVFGPLAARLSGVARVVSTRHGTHRFYNRAPVRQIDTLAARLCDQGVAISEYAREFFIKNGAFRPDGIRTIYYGLDGLAPADPELWRARAGCYSGEVVVGVVGRLIPGKGQDVFLEAGALLERNQNGRPVQYWIVGAGSQRGYLERKTADLGVSDRVRFWGYQTDIPGLLAAMDVVCVPTSPSFGEGLNLVLLEAGAAGKPAVASRMGPFPEVIIDGQTGLLVEPDNPVVLAEALGRLIRDESLRIRMGAAAQRRVRDRFSLPRAVAAYEALYAELGLQPSRVLHL